MWLHPRTNSLVHPYWFLLTAYVPAPSELLGKVVVNGLNRAPETGSVGAGDGLAVQELCDCRFEILEPLGIPGNLEIVDGAAVEKPSTPAEQITTRRLLRKPLPGDPGAFVPQYGKGELPAANRCHHVLDGLIDSGGNGGKAQSRMPFCETIEEGVVSHAVRA